MRFSLSILLLTTAVAGAEPRVVDGDTLELDGVTYRLNGIDAPEHGQRCGDWACGADATRALADIVEGATVTCTRMSEDGYGRVIATCQADGRDIGKEMIDKGMAWAFLKYSDAYAADELVSKDKAHGVFAEAYTPPWEYRAARWQAAESKEEDAPPGCVIKGNISERGRIYHAPWSRAYARTRINTFKGERWFCSEAEAVAAGWRAPRWN